MKIIQSHWSKPSLQGTNTFIENRHNGGFASQKMQYMAYALSCLKFKQFYDKVELYTDAQGYELLIEKLKLPYTKVHVRLDEMNHVPPLLWAIPKIYTYSLQNEPFIHADTDVFIWKKFSDAFEQSPLLAQHEENHPVYLKSLEFISKNFEYIPEVIRNYDAEQRGVFSINAGVFGGHDLLFIQDYCREALDFFTKNLDFLSKYEMAGAVNIIIEQYLFYRLAAEKGKNINFLLDNVAPDYSNLCNFHMLPHYQSYIHLVGGAKAIEMMDTMISWHLKYEFPEYYDHINELLDTPSNITYAADINITNSDTCLKQFENTIAALKFYHCIEKDDNIIYETVVAAFERLAQLPLETTTLTFLQDVFTYEQTKYLLNAECKESRNEEYIYKAFCVTRDFLTNNDKESILEHKFKLDSTTRIILLSYNVLEITAAPDWLLTLDSTFKNAQQGEYIVMLTKEGNNKIEGNYVIETEQMLYYFSFDPISGNELASFLAGEDASPDTLEFYKQEAFDIITRSLTYGGYICVEQALEPNAIKVTTHNQTFAYDSV